MNKFNENSRFALELLHASEPDGDDRLDAFTLLHDGRPLFEIHVDGDADDAREFSLTVKRLTDDTHASDLPGIHGSVHLGCVIYAYLVERLDAVDCPFFAELFYDEDGTPVKRLVDLQALAAIAA